MNWPLPEWSKFYKSRWESSHASVTNVSVLRSKVKNTNLYIQNGCHSLRFEKNEKFKSDECTWEEHGSVSNWVSDIWFPVIHEPVKPRLRRVICSLTQLSVRVFISILLPLYCKNVKLTELHRMRTEVGSLYVICIV